MGCFFYSGASPRGRPRRVLEVANSTESGRFFGCLVEKTSACPYHEACRTRHDGERFIRDIDISRERPPQIMSEHVTLELTQHQRDLVLEGLRYIRSSRRYEFREPSTGR